MKTTNRSVTNFLVFVLFFCVSAFFAQGVLAANVSGEAWSETIGWIRFAGNATNGDPYGVTIAANGTMSGYAWSENIGAISFESASLSGCPSGACTASVNPTAVGGKNYISGWARACAVFAAGCSGALKSNNELGGWDGWIKLDGVAGGLPYGWYVDASGYFHGYVFGASNLGSADLSTGIIGWVSANCLEGSSTGTSICAQSDYKVRTTASFGPTAAMSCDPVATGNTCPGGVCDNGAGAAWRVYLPNGACTTCGFTVKNDSTGAIAQTTWELVGTTYSFNGSGKTDFTFPVLDLPAGDYTLKLTVVDGSGVSSSATRTVNIRRDIMAKPKCTFDNPNFDPINNPSPNPNWMDCDNSAFKSGVAEGEKIYLNDVSSGSDSGSGPTVIVDHLWTLTANGSTVTSNNAATEFLAGRTNTITLRVNDNNTPVRTCTKSSTFNGMSLPEWQEVGPVGMILRLLTAKISDFFATL